MAKLAWCLYLVPLLIVNPAAAYESDEAVRFPCKENATVKSCANMANPFSDDHIIQVDDTRGPPPSAIFAEIIDERGIGEDGVGSSITTTIIIGWTQDSGDHSKARARLRQGIEKNPLEDWLGTYRAYMVPDFYTGTVDRSRVRHADDGNRWVRLDWMIGIRSPCSAVPETSPIMMSKKRSDNDISTLEVTKTVPPRSEDYTISS